MALQPNRRDEEDVLGAIVELDRRPGNPRPRQRYYGDVGCSGLAYFPLVGPRGASPRSGRRPLLQNRAAATRRPSRAPSLSWRTRTRTSTSARCRWRFSRTAWRCGRCPRGAGAGGPCQLRVPSEVVAFHANYVVGASQKRAWLESLGLWFD